ncbi:hypothetical protein NHX12_005101 [Muraenolepis orangiensis]|uniref:Uncharacterized protein n=1 Tax=Muraenolepis orangiensis TaxID=630683 RepID=A0A9Q0DQW9_9TELE|nr:hypothetical protein NHX12_005101 [Muraenolepis orangiensis]
MDVIAPFLPALTGGTRGGGDWRSALSSKERRQSGNRDPRSLAAPEPSTPAPDPGVDLSHAKRPWGRPRPTPEALGSTPSHSRGPRVDPVPCQRPWGRPVPRQRPGVDPVPRQRPWGRPGHLTTTRYWSRSVAPSA